MEVCGGVGGVAEGEGEGGWETRVVGFVTARPCDSRNWEGFSLGWEGTTLLGRPMATITSVYRYFNNVVSPTHKQRIEMISVSCFFCTNTKSVILLLIPVVPYSAQLQ